MRHGYRPITGGNPPRRVRLQGTALRRGRRRAHRLNRRRARTVAGELRLHGWPEVGIVFYHTGTLAAATGYGPPDPGGRPARIASRVGGHWRWAVAKGDSVPHPLAAVLP